MTIKSRKSPIVCPHGRRPYPVRDEDGAWVLVGCPECYEDLRLLQPWFLSPEDQGEWRPLPGEE